MPLGLKTQAHGSATEYLGRGSPQWVEGKCEELGASRSSVGESHLLLTEC